MTLLRTKEIRAMRPDDVKAKFRELSDELMHERGVAAMGGAPASPGKLRALRTNIARIHTITRELEIAAAVKAGQKKAPAKEEKAGEEPKRAAKPKERKAKTEKKAKKATKKEEKK